MRVSYLLLVELPEGDAAGHEDGGSLRHAEHCAVRIAQPSAFNLMNRVRLNVPSLEIRMLRVCIWGGSCSTALFLWSTVEFWAKAFIRTHT
jgi:hypothetical protein